MMKNSEINRRIGQAFSNAAPDVLDSVLSDCREEKGAVIIINNRKKNSFRRLAAAAAAFVLLLGGASAGVLYRAEHKAVSIVSLDVNPSIEIKVNSKEKVIEVLPLNEDGKTVVGSMDFEGSSVDVAVNALIGSMLRNGYISELANSILVSVDSEDAAEAEQLQSRLSQEIDELLHTESFTGSVLSQTVQADSELSALADSYGISLGKAQLIRQIVGENPRYTFEDLVALSINDLNLILSSGSTARPNVNSTGTASDKNYISRDEAIEAALTAADLKREDVRDLDAEFDCFRGVMIYEVDFDNGGREYEYRVDALSGEIVSDDLDWDDDYSRYQFRQEQESQPQGTQRQNRRGWDDMDDWDDRIEEWAERKFGFDL